jgi:site-specific DNA-methyltransferase (adenine-specific)
MPESVQDRPSRCHEYVFLFSKSEHYRFSRSGLEKGHAITRKSVWNIPRGRSDIKGHHAVFPEALVLPCIQSATRENDFVLDPFCGTGTVGCVCSKLQRRFIGIEINTRFAKAAVKRLGKGANWLRSIQSSK